MSEVCAAPDIPALERYPAFAGLAAVQGVPPDTFYNLFAQNGANKGAIAIVEQLLSLPKEEQPEAMHVFNYTGTDYTSVVQDAASAAIAFFGTDVTFYSVDGSLIVDPAYTEYLVTAAISFATNFSYTTAATFPEENRAPVRQQIVELQFGALGLSQVACAVEYPDNPKYAGLFQRCENGDVPIHPWLSATDALYVQAKEYKNVTGIPEICLPYGDGECGYPNPHNFIQRIEIEENAVGLSDYWFLLTESFGEDSSCLQESLIVQTVARATDAYLPFCGTNAEKDTILPYMMGYYFGATDGGVFCKEQSLPLIISRLQWVLSVCEPEDEYPFIPPCTVLHAFYRGHQIGTSGLSIECLYDSFDFEELSNCTAAADYGFNASDYCSVLAPNGCSVRDLDDPSGQDCPISADYGACPADESTSAAAGGFPKMTLYATALLWALRKFTF